MKSVKELYSMYEKFIFRYLYGLTSNYHVAEELTQETFYQVVKSIHTFRGDSSVTTWLYKIARNVLYSWRRKKCNTEASLEEDHINANLQAPSRDGPDELMEHRERIELVRSCLKQLPENYRELLLLREWQELSYEEISVIMGKSLSWVKVNLHRARLELKKALVEKEGMEIE